MPPPATSHEIQALTVVYRVKLCMSKLEQLQTTDNILRKVNEMDPYSFEELIVELFDNISRYRDVRKTPGSGDQGIDAIATEKVYKYPGQVDNYTIAIQAKHYTHTKVNSGMVRNYSKLSGPFKSGMYPSVNAFDRIYIVTSGKFTTPAKELLYQKRHSVESIDSSELAHLIKYTPIS